MEISALKTDLYEFSMAAGYFNGYEKTIATFELFLFNLPPNRGYIIAAGLADAINFIKNLKFQDAEIDYLKTHPFLKNVDAAFFEYLRNLKFTGNVSAVPEGTVVFENEPIIQITAPIIEAQILETYLLSLFHISSLVATKASRVVGAASKDGKERAVIDFGSRRAHGPEAAVLAARASYIGGASGTSNTFAGMKYGIPTFGTMAHSFIQAFENEETAFRKFKEAFPENTIFLIDTYDTIKAARMISKIGGAIKAVRIDSGNLKTLSKAVRRILDTAALKDVKIMASGNLNEYKIENLVKSGAPIDFFGVGTEMVTSFDVPALNMVYKLVEIVDRKGNRIPKTKFSSGKNIMPFAKEVFRELGKAGRFKRDIIAIKGGSIPKGNFIKLLEPVIANGKLVRDIPTLEASRDTVRKGISLLEDKYKLLKSPKKYPVIVTSEIKKVFKTLRKKGLF